MHHVGGIKGWSIAAGLVLALLVAACAAEGDGVSPTEPDPPELSDEDADFAVEGTLSQWGIQEGGEAPVIAAFIEEFNAAHPGATIEHHLFTSEEYWARVVASFAAGNPPDFFGNPAGELLARHARVGQLARLNDLLDFDYYSPAAVEAFRSADGDIYAVPRFAFSIVMWSNEDLLAQYDLEQPQTWDDLLAACQTLSADGVIPIALGNGGQDQWTAQFLMEGLIYQYGGTEIMQDATWGVDGASWSDTPLIEAATRLQEAVDANCFPPGFTGLNYSQMQTLFLRGEAAMMFMGTWFGSALEDTPVDFEVDVFGYPDASGALHSTATFEGIIGGVAGVAVSRQAVENHPGLVAAYLDAWGAAVDDYANETGNLSVAANPQPRGDTLQVKMTEQLAMVEDIAPAMDTVTPSAIHAAFFQTIHDLTAGVLSPEEWAQAMADAVERERPNFPEEPELEE